MLGSSCDVLLIFNFLFENNERERARAIIRFAKHHTSIIPFLTWGVQNKIYFFMKTTPTYANLVVGLPKLYCIMVTNLQSIN